MHTSLLLTLLSFLLSLPLLPPNPAAPGTTWSHYTVAQNGGIIKGGNASGDRGMEAGCAGVLYLYWFWFGEWRSCLCGGRDVLLPGSFYSLKAALSINSPRSNLQHQPNIKRTSNQNISLSAILKGTVNDPMESPPSRTHDSYHCALERLLAVSLVPMTVAAFVISGLSYPVLDVLLGISLVMHSHIGTLRSAMVGVLVDADQFNTNNVDLMELIAKVWTDAGRSVN
ncbi:CybS-domain-containing protein [Suillus paluster]|uniref:CybS-domain-containing protein n=1 Tax=Suillus paluster TaxID=48578 RepID=UPI001B87E1CF|nr:CybS-domain-containing protein [Suillus paluster]KAG1733197.1 CybS-domain-containing protein [Suillus paluster]